MTRFSCSALLTGFAAVLFSATLAAQSTPAPKPHSHESSGSHEATGGCCAHEMDHSQMKPSASHDHGAAAKEMNCAMCAEKMAKASCCAGGGEACCAGGGEGCCAGMSHKSAVLTDPAGPASHERSAREAEAYARSWRTSKDPNGARLAERWDALARDHRGLTASFVATARSTGMPKMECMEMASAK